MTVSTTRIFSKEVHLGELPEFIDAAKRQVARGCASHRLALVGEPAIDFPESAVGGLDLSADRIALRLTWQTEPTQ